MRHSDDVFQLIKSLSKSEKRYFKMFASMRKGEKKYLLLFDAIDRQEVYDETALKEEFRNERFVRQLGVAKGYLYNLILKSLRVIYSDVGTEAQVQSLLRNAQLLNRRGLLEQAQKTLDKAIALCRAHGHNQRLVEALVLRERMRTDLHTSRRSIEETWDEIFDALDCFRNALDYQVLLRTMGSTIVKGSVRSAADRQALEETALYPLLQNSDLARSTTALERFHWTWTIYHYGREEFQQALEHAMRMVEIKEEHPAEIYEEPIFFILYLNNCLDIQKRLGDMNGFRRTVAKLRSYGDDLLRRSHDRDIGTRVTLLRAIYFNQLALYIECADFEQALRLEENIMEQINAYGRLVEKHLRLKVFSHFAYVHTALGNYRKALDYNNRILLEPESTRGAYTHYSARLLNLILHFELGNIDLLERLVPSTYRYLLSRQHIYRFESAMLEFFRELSRVVSRSDLTDAFIRVRDRLRALEDDPVEKNALYEFGYLNWLESKITSRSFTETARANYRREFSERSVEAYS